MIIHWIQLKLLLHKRWLVGVEFNTPPNIIEVISEADTKDSLTVC